MTRGALELFYCYASKDEALRAELEKHLHQLQQNGYISQWGNYKIKGGELRESAVESHLATAHIILLLISSDFISSDYIHHVVLQKALQRHEAGEAKVIPVLLRDTLIVKDSPLYNLKMLPEDGRPVVGTRGRSRDKAFASIAESISKIVDELNAKKGHTPGIPSSGKQHKKNVVKEASAVLEPPPLVVPAAKPASSSSADDARSLDMRALSRDIHTYYQELQRLRNMGVESEEGLRPAFQKLLAKAADQVGLLLITEQIIDNGIKPDGIVRDGNNLRRGYWEAKGPKGHLEHEIRDKIKDGYPLTNILFENTREAVLYQNKREVYRCTMQEEQKIKDLLEQFLTYIEPNIEKFQAAVVEFKGRIPGLANDLLERIKKEHDENPKFKLAFADFAQLCRTSLNPDLSNQAIDEMLVQHLLTERLFRTVFDNPDFVRRNIIAAEIEKVVQALTSRSFNRQEFFKSLDRYYKAIEGTAREIESWSERQEFLNAVYEGFFQGFSTKQADTHGIVYTPQEIVDFMCASVDEVMKREFGSSISAPDIRILDPATGTGNFIVNIIRHYIDPWHLAPKYHTDLFCNEVMLLPYYIASLNIEHEYYVKMKSYVPFEGICFADTLELAEDVHEHSGNLVRQNQIFMVEENTERVNRERESKIEIIIGNPPYNVGQRRENDNSKNRTYEIVDRRVRETYAKDSKASNKNALWDVYVRFFRWAADRLENHDGIVCLVTNNSFVEQIAFDGMRKHMLKDFTHIYHLDLHGNIRKNPKLSGSTHNVFGIQVGVGITLAIRSARHTSRELYYHRVPEIWERTEKLAFLQKVRSIYGIDWQELQPDSSYTWLTDGLHPEFSTFIPLGTKDAKGGRDNGIESSSAKTLFKTYSQGVQTGRDEWMYDFDREHLAHKVTNMIETYNAEVSRWRRAGSPKAIDTFVEKDESKIKWSSRLKECLERNIETRFEAKKIRDALYRPFSRQFLYFDSIMTHRRSLLPQILPDFASENENILICLTTLGSEKPFMTLATNLLPDLHLVGAGSGTQSFPFYIYSEDGSNRRENITNWALQQFQSRYGPAVTKWDIFHYIYAMLHHPRYRERYVENLKRELPHIPFLHRTAAFETCVRIGRTLMDIHIHYEQQQEYKLEKHPTPGVPFSWHVEKMRLSSDRRVVVVNESLRLGPLPDGCFEYRLGNRSALEWILDQYQVSENKYSGIKSNPNRANDEEYIVRLIGRVVTVSLETMKLVRQLSETVSVEDWL